MLGGPVNSNKRTSCLTVHPEDFPPTLLTYPYLIVALSPPRCLPTLSRDAGSSFDTTFSKRETINACRKGNSIKNKDESLVIGAGFAVVSNCTAQPPPYRHRTPTTTTRVEAKPLPPKSSGPRTHKTREVGSCRARVVVFQKNVERKKVCVPGRE